MAGPWDRRRLHAQRSRVRCASGPAHRPLAEARAARNATLKRGVAGSGDFFRLETLFLVSWLTWQTELKRHRQLVSTKQASHHIELLLGLA